jgi:hypothetical protein
MPKQRKPKMPKNAGIRFDPATGQSWVAYEVTVTINPAEYGVSPGATNREMVEAVIEAVKQDAIKRERKAIADAVLNAKVNPFSVWRLVVEGGAPIMRHTEGRAASLADWIEHGMYRPSVAAESGKETP